MYFEDKLYELKSLTVNKTDEGDIVLIIRSADGDPQKQGAIGLDRGQVMELVRGLKEWLGDD